MFNFKRWFVKPKWTEVKVLTVAGVENDSKRSVTVYIHLLESSTGERKYEALADRPGYSARTVDEFIKTAELYNTQLHRWLLGRFDPEIPRYNQIPEEDTIAALRGKSVNV